MGQHGMTPYYSEKLGKGMEYQDFLIKPLIQHGLVFQQYASKRYQQEKGESFNGIEVKYDMRMAETGNAYIEVAEKSNPNNAEYIKAFTSEGDVVAEPFGGSGTTLIACEQLGRECMCMELDPTYCDIIIERWQNLTGEAAVKVS